MKKTYELGQLSMLLLLVNGCKGHRLALASLIIANRNSNKYEATQEQEIVFCAMLRNLRACDIFDVREIAYTYADNVLNNDNLTQCLIDSASQIIPFIEGLKKEQFDSIKTIGQLIAESKEPGK